jgi:hypothetical protein
MPLSLPESCSPLGKRNVGEHPVGEFEHREIEEIDFELTDQRPQRCNELFDLIVAKPCPPTLLGLAGQRSPHFLRLATTAGGPNQPVRARRVGAAVGWIPLDDDVPPPLQALQIRSANLALELMEGGPSSPTNCMKFFHTACPIPYRLERSQVPHKAKGAHLKLWPLAT